MTHLTTERPEGPTSRLVTFFRSAKDPAPVEDIPVEVVLERIRSCMYQRNVDEVLAAPAKDQQSVKARVLPAFTPAGRFSYRSKESLVEHSGLVVLDIDDKTNAEAYKTELALDPHVFAAFFSPRGGVKVLVRVTVVDRESGEMRAPASNSEHEAGMARVFEHFSDFEPDPSGSDVARLCYVSADPDVYMNAAAEPIEIDVQSDTSPTAAINDVNQREKKAAGRAPFEATIPQGMQYATLLMIVGALRRLGLGVAILTSVARKVFDDHLEDPNNWSKVESMVRDIAEKPVESHTTAEAMARRAVKTLQKFDLLGDLIDDGVYTTPLPWLPFPTDALPPSAQAYVRAQAAATNTDEAFVAVPMLVMLSAAVGNSFRIQIKRSWEEPSTLWALIVAASGTGKSPTTYAALKPVFTLEREATERYEAMRAEYDALDKEQKKDTPEPHRRRFRVGDATIESLMAIHEQNQRGLLLYRDEAAGWFGSFDKYSRGESDLQSWLETYNGRSLVIDRKSTDKPVLQLDRPNVSVAGTIQPNVLRSRLSDTHFSSGFAARLLLVEPPVYPKRWTEADITEEVDADYHRLIRGLYTLPYRGAVNANNLELTPEAKVAFIAFWEENGRKQHALSSGPLQAALSKHEALAARCALALHLSNHVDTHGSYSASVSPGPISGSAMRRGVHLARWFRYETARLYQKYGVEENAVDRDVSLATQLSHTFSWQDVAKLWEVEKSNTYKTVLPRLIERGLIEKTGHGEYRRLSSPLGQRGLVDFGNFELTEEAVHEEHSDMGYESHESPASFNVHEVHESAKPAENPQPDDQSGERPTQPLMVREILSYEREPLRYVEVEGPEGPIAKRVSGIKRTYGKTCSLDEIFGKEDAPRTPESTGDAG